MERQKTIYQQQWIKLHKRSNSSETDKWYVDFANRLKERIIHSPDFYYDTADNERVNELALMLTLYFEDCIADEGGWRHFSLLFRKRYGKDLPFYHTDKTYCPDEINEEDIAFLLWKMNSRVDEDEPGNNLPEGTEASIADPFNQNTLNLASIVYQMMDEEFEEAPITSLPSPDWVMEFELLTIESSLTSNLKPTDKTTEKGMALIQYNKGKQLCCFENINVFKDFWTNILQWKTEEMPNDLAQANNVVALATKRGVVMAPNLAPYFEENGRHNTAYRPDVVKSSAYKLFIRQGLCPADLLKYAMLNNLMEQAELPFNNGKTLLKENWDFIARYFLRTYYEE